MDRAPASSDERPGFLLGFGDSSEGNLRDVFNGVVTMRIEDDGVVFDTVSLEVGPIRENQEFERSSSDADGDIAEAKVRLQVEWVR